MQHLPDGVITFLMTDIEGSTRLWEDAPDSMMDALRLHDALIEDAAETNDGVVVRPRGEGDSRFIVFRSAINAAAGAAEMQRRLAEAEWPTPRPLRVRASLHTGLAELELGDYYGSAVNRAARLRAIAHGGQTVLSGSTYELVQDRLPEGASVTDLGSHRLKDLTRPEQVYQLNVDGNDPGFPPLTSLDATPNNLPVQLTDFVGRRSDLETAQVTLDKTRLLTILAPGGAGKTRLAIQVAAEVAPSFRDGVFFVDLAPTTSPEDIIQAVAESLGIALPTEEDVKSQLLAYLANKSQLLVLDNFEHVVAGASLVTDILRHAPQVKVMATSRSKLNVSGETVQTLGGLESDWGTPEEAFHTASVQLFVDAARRADVGFAIAVDDLEPLARILRAVGGMPLGIELAAAWVGVLPVGEIASEIAKSLDFLESEAGDVPDRHRSVRAVFEYSWRMLSEDERRIFSALSVFRGGFTRAAAEEVTGASIRHLANLTSKSLLGSDRETGRYAVHELLRQYAEAALQEDPTRLDHTLAAHAGFYADLTERAARLIPGDEHSLLGIVEGDLDNIRLAWRYSLGRQDGATAGRFVRGLWFLHEIRGWHQAGASLFEEALASLDPSTETAAAKVARATAAITQAWFLSHLGQAEHAAAQTAQSMAILKAHADETSVLMAIQYQCAPLTYLNRWEEVVAVTADGIKLAEAAGDEWLSVELKTWAAFACLWTPDLDLASRLFEESEAFYARFGEHRSRSWNQAGIGLLAMKQGRIADAVDTLDKMVQLAKEIGYRRAIQGGLQYLGEAQVAAGQLEAAEKSFLEGLAMSEQMGQVLEMAGMLTRIAQVNGLMGKQELGMQILASVLADPISSRPLLAESTPVRDLAQALFDRLTNDLPGTSVDTRGGAKSIQTTAKELLAP